MKQTEKITNKDNHHLVSIIIPVYNAQKYLSDCVSSVLNQTYRNLEILLIDDGSTDHSGDICDRYAASDTRIKAYHKKNAGLSFSRNFGIQHSHGDYMMFLDADDFIVPNMIEDLLNICIENAADLCISGFYRVSDQGTIISCKKYNYQIFEKDQVKNELLPKMIGSRPGRKDCIYSMAWGKLYSSSSVKESHVLFQSERIIKAEDIAFQIDYLPFVQKAVIINNCYYKHRETSSSVTVKNRKNHLADSIFFHQYMVDKIKFLNLPSETLLRADEMFLSHVLTGLKLELPTFSNNSLHTCYKDIKYYVQNPVIQEVLSTYPVSQANIMQRLYYILLKRKQSSLLILALEILVLRDLLKEHLNK